MLTQTGTCGRVVCVSALIFSPGLVWAPGTVWAQDGLIVGTIQARHSGASVEVAEPDRWKAYATELKRERDEKDARLSDLKVLLEKALSDLDAARGALDRMTLERDALRSGSRAKRTE